MNTPAQAGARSGLERWAGLGAVLYVVLFIGGSILSFGGTPDGDAAPAKVVAYYSDSGHRDKIGAGWIAVVLGIFFFLWFLGALRQVLRRLDGDGFLTTVATVGGAVYAASTLTGISLYMAIATMSDDTFRDRVYPELIHAGNDAGYIIHSAGSVAIGALIIATSVATMRAGLIPGWAGWVGVLFGILALGSIAFFPQALVAIWLLVAGIAVFRSAAPPAPPEPATPD